MVKKLRRGRDVKIAGVCSGIAERFDTDPTAIRVLWALLTVFTAVLPGVIAYVICWIVMPKAQ
jgi:phage shock protein PspC (stress-responsive transcriptional regulator)